MFSLPVAPWAPWAGSCSCFPCSLVWQCLSRTKQGCSREPPNQGPSARGQWVLLPAHTPPRRPLPLHPFSCCAPIGAGLASCLGCSVPPRGPGPLPPCWSEGEGHPDQQGCDQPHLCPHRPHSLVPMHTRLHLTSRHRSGRSLHSIAASPPGAQTPTQGPSAPARSCKRTQPSAGPWLGLRKAVCLPGESGYPAPQRRVGEPLRPAREAGCAQIRDLLRITRCGPACGPTVAPTPRPPSAPSARGCTRPAPSSGAGLRLM